MSKGLKKKSEKPFGPFFFLFITNFQFFLHFPYPLDSLAMYYELFFIMMFNGRVVISTMQ